MRQPLDLTLSMARYLAGKKLRGVKRFPLVLMLEPTFQCNLHCQGCGKVRQPSSVLRLRMSLQECLRSVEECGAPAVSIAGGEPLVHPEIGQIVEGILGQGKLTLLCTNGLLIDQALSTLRPHPHFVFVFHLDGLREQHDQIAGREGVYDQVIDGIQRCKGAGYRVATNTTFYRSTQPEKCAQLLRLVMKLGVDSCIVSPAFGYEELGDGHADFLSRHEAQLLFRAIESRAGKVRYYNTPMYVEFLRGDRSYQCSPWGNPTRDPIGWKSPCYLLTDGHFSTFKELMEQTAWQDFGYGKNPRCSGCAMHSGYEPTAVNQIGLRELLPMARWMLA